MSYIIKNPPLYEQWHNGGFVVSEANGHRSRDLVTITGGVNVLAGTVLGQITSTNASPVANAVAGASNVGNGTLAIGTQPVLNVTPAGAWTITFTDATHFSMSGPGGFVEVDLPVGTAFDAEGMVFTITAGGTAFAAGDTFVITVTSPGTAGQYRPLNPSASDGTQNAAAILWATTNVTMENSTATVISRSAEVNASELLWPVSATPTQIAAATAQLNALGIVLR